MGAQHAVRVVTDDVTRGPANTAEAVEFLQLKMAGLIHYDDGE
jgi:hypothetical protein